MNFTEISPLLPVITAILTIGIVYGAIRSFMSNTKDQLKDHEKRLTKLEDDLHENREGIVKIETMLVEHRRTSEAGHQTLMNMMSETQKAILELSKQINGNGIKGH